MSTLQGKMIRGLAWSSIAKLAVQIISWISTFIVIRLLTPEDYGVVAISMAVIGLMTIIAEFGLSDALIQRKNLKLENLSQVFTANLGFSLLCTLLIIAFSEFFAVFYQSEGQRAIGLPSIRRWLHRVRRGRRRHAGGGQDCRCGNGQFAAHTFRRPIDSRHYQRHSYQALSLM